MNRCKKCKELMVGEGDECSDCAWPTLTKAIEGARKDVEQLHFKRTGEKKTAGELFRKALGMK